MSHPRFLVVLFARQINVFQLRQQDDIQRSPTSQIPSIALYVHERDSFPSEWGVLPRAAGHCAARRGVLRLDPCRYGNNYLNNDI